MQKAFVLCLKFEGFEWVLVEAMAVLCHWVSVKRDINFKPFVVVI
jgi:hypothetical protein